MALTCSFILAERTGLRGRVSLVSSVHLRRTPVCLRPWQSGGNPWLGDQLAQPLRRTLCVLAVMLEAGIDIALER